MHTHAKNTNIFVCQFGSFFFSRFFSVVYYSVSVCACRCTRAFQRYHFIRSINFHLHRICTIHFVGDSDCWQRVFISAKRFTIEINVVHNVFIRYCAPCPAIVCVRCVDIDCAHVIPAHLHIISNVQMNERAERKTWIRKRGTKSKENQCKLHKCWLNYRSLVLWRTGKKGKFEVPEWARRWYFYWNHQRRHCVILH